MGHKRLRIKAILVVLLPLVAVSVFSQDQSSAQQPPWDPVTVARAHLASAGVRTGPGASFSGQEVVDVRESAASIHVRLQQTLRGIPIDGAISTLSMKRGAQRVRFAVDRQRQDLNYSAIAATVSLDDAELAARNVVGVTELLGEPNGRLIYVPRGLELILAWEVRIPAREPLGDWLTTIDATTGDVIAFNNLVRFDSGQVFNPNPAASSGYTIPPPSDCDTAGNATTLAGQRVVRALLGITAAQNKLKGQYVDLTAPGITGGYQAAGQADEPTRTYNYNCNDDRFEEVMIYHYVDSTQRKLQTLGFTGTSAILASAIPAHAHWDNDCNAFYYPFNEGIHFMDGNPAICKSDTGEDGDVIVHEYGHALQDAATPGWGFNSNPLLVEQTGSMGEGWGDFLTGAMFGDTCIGGWALNELYAVGEDCLRDMNNAKVFPADFEACPDLPDGSEEVHCGGELWGATLWDLVEAFGNDAAARDLALRLVLDAQFYLSPVASFNDAAGAIRQADVDLYGGAHVTTINAVFAARGFNSTGTASDFPYYFLRIRHTFVGDLEVRLKVGSTTTPICNELIWDHDGGGADDLMGAIPISDSACAAFFPPTVGQPWYLEARDDFATDTGYIDAFEVALNGSRRCIATNVPLNIPDGTNVPVAASINCTSFIDAQPTATASGTLTQTPTSTSTSASTATPTPTATATVDPNDLDGDGVLNASDNCPTASNSDQTNTDFAPLTTVGPPALPNDTTVPNSDTQGDACDLDDDNDGVLDTDESAGCNGSGPLDPLNADTDDDRNRDGAECVLGTNPASAASKPAQIPAGDTDTDGLPDALEVSIGSTPGDSDSDDNGIPDGIEFRGYSLSPNNPNTDGDLCSDAREIASINVDNIVNSGDFGAVASVFNRTDRPVHDVNKNGIVNSLDLNLMAIQFTQAAC